MVTAPAAADAVARAKRLPGLKVGLHLVLIDGVPVMPAAELGNLVTEAGEFDGNQLRASLRFFFVPRMRRRLAAEIRAQFAAFAATGLELDHVNAHKHMHLHPTVARRLVEAGAEYGVRAVRVPAEPADVLRRSFPNERYSAPLHAPAIGLLRRRLRSCGIASNDHVFGIAWSGGMTEDRLLALLPNLPPGVSEIYAHPARRTTPALAAAMPGYRHADELAALVSPAVKQRIAELGIEIIAYSDLSASAWTGSPRTAGAAGGSVLG
jgi:hopanoid biosynthesis associated protein HpnK